MNGSSQTRCYRNQPEEATPERSTQHSKQTTHEHGMICGMRYAMHMHASEKNDWTWTQHGNTRVPLERGDDFDRNRYKDHQNRMHGLEMASKTNMAPRSAIISKWPSKCIKINKLLHSNMATKYTAGIHSWCLTKDEHWATANSLNNRFKQTWQKCKR